MKKIILIILVCCVQVESTAQDQSARFNLDSIRRLTHRNDLPDSVRIMAYFTIAQMHENSGNFDSSLYYTIRGRKEAEKADFKYGIAVSYSKEGSTWMDKNMFKEAIKCQLKVAELCREMKNERGVIGTYLNIGGIYSKMSMPDKSIIYLNQALGDARRLKWKEAEYMIMSNLAYTYHVSGDDKKSVRLNQELLKIMEESKIADTMAYTAALHNMGEAEESMGDWNSAVKNYLKAYTINKSQPDRYNFLENNLGALGSLFLKDTLNTLGRQVGDNRPSLEISMSYLKELEKLAITINDTGTLVSCYLVLCRVYLAKGETPAALKVATTGWDWCKKFSTPESYEEYLGVLGKLYFALGRYRESAIFYRDQKAYSDSLKKVEMTEKVAQLSNSYEVEQLDEQLKVKEQQLKDNRFITWLFVAISALILILALIIFYFLRQKQKVAKLLELQNHEIEKARNRAVQSEKFKERFLASMSHEIRTPLNAVIGMTGLLLDEKQPPKTENYLRNIKQAGEHLTGIINDILDLSKIEAGKLELHESPFSLQLLLEEMKNLFGVRAKEKALQLIIPDPEGVSEWVSGDSQRIRQVLLNLAGNAIKFTDNGSVQIKISLEGTEGRMQLIRFMVEDTGSGIPESEQAAIFEEFVQVGESGDQKVAGTGLGLSISKKLVERMGGTLKVVSEPGKGSIFSFTIPLEISSESAYSAIRSEKEKSLTAMKGKFRILVVDDNLSNQIVTEGMLERLLPESRVTMAENGYKALEMLEKDRFDLVLMDVRMPGMDGYETTGKLRQLRNENATVPVVALTASVIRADIQHCLEAGMDGYVPKPVNREMLAKAIREQLKISEQDTVMAVISTGPDFLKDLNETPLWAPGLYEMCNGKKARFIGYLQLFISETDKELVRWNDLVETEQHELLARSIHKIKPHIKIFSGEEYFSLAGNLEESLRSQWDPSFTENIQRLRDKILEAQKEAHALIRELA
jgi:signal transduction histidine kinase/CheY-like chemotaxis protein/HPt (histidine-containing phosphotransfer) domain-containing protein